ncbi:MAG: FkbM family methyltransferase [Anaerolineales bacterium]|nr:FkbM family methyltransferase [Anaerolineales bacterium]
MSLYRECVTKIENLVARYGIGLELAFRIRLFANAVIYNSMYPERNEHIDRDIEYNGELEFIQLVAPHVETFIDVGANIGNWTALLMSFSKSAVTGFLYEPSKCAMEKLISQYGNDRRLSLFRTALGDECGMTTFYEEPNAGQTSSVVKGVSDRASIPVQIPLTTLDHEFEKHHLDHVDMVKIDAEGYDGYILKGAKRILMEQRIGAIQFEYNTSWLNARFTLAEALNLLEKAGYVTYQVTKEQIAPYDYQTYQEYFNYGIFIGINPKMKHIGPMRFQG